jgi:hypothetical protein
MATRSLTIPVTPHQHPSPSSEQRQTTTDTEQSPNRAGIRMPRGARPHATQACVSPGAGRVFGPSANARRGA